MIHRHLYLFFPNPLGLCEKMWESVSHMHWLCYTDCQQENVGEHTKLRQSEAKLEDSFN